MKKRLWILLFLSVLILFYLIYSYIQATQVALAFQELNNSVTLTMSDNSDNTYYIGLIQGANRALSINLKLIMFFFSIDVVIILISLIKQYRNTPKSSSFSAAQRG